MLSGKKVQSAGKTSGDLKGDASGANVLANWGGPHTLEDFYGSRCIPFSVFLGWVKDCSQKIKEVKAPLKLYGDS